MNKKIKESNNNRPKPFIAPGSNVAITRQEIEKREKRIARLEAIGQSVTKVTEEEECENPYRVEALIYIMNDEDVPEELLEKIRKFDEKYKKKVMAKE